MTHTSLTRFTTYPAEDSILSEVSALAALSDADRESICAEAADLVTTIRTSGRPGMMEVFLAEYGLSTDEGIALMCLAEALLRVPDPETIDELIEDKIAPSNWGKHLGHSSSSLVNASTWALMLTGRVLDETGPGVAGAMRQAIKRLGEPVIRTAVGRAMREMGQQFVLGETMKSAMTRAAGMEAKGYTYSYDMLGEAARTEADAKRYFASYADAIRAAGQSKTGTDVKSRPGVSVKLSALHPRYEVSQRDRVVAELAPRLVDLAVMAAERNIGLNIDAEEADRLELSFDVIEAALADERLAKWDGFGIVVQAYGLRAAPVIDHIYALAERFDRKLMVRLVKGAYWDTEIKRAQILGLDRFPVFTAKEATDVSYIGCARKLLGMTDRIYPQFATHNAHTVQAVLHMSRDTSKYEFQRLHGMGEPLHEAVRKQHKTRCRIYAPVGAHRDLLAYLVRRLLENGANSSFVNQLVDEDVPATEVASDPFKTARKRPNIPTGAALYEPERANSKGWDITDGPTLRRLEDARAPFKTHTWSAAPIVAAASAPGDPLEVRNPANPDEIVGHVTTAEDTTIEAALAAATPWTADTEARAATLNRVADLYEQSAPELFALLAREAGKTLLDCVGEVREAVDFLRYYATQAAKCTSPGVGTVTCISPWNFPLAIFTGQIAGALAAGCAVLAKPAEQTPLVAHRAVQLMLEAGVPATALQYLPGTGATVGRALTSDPRIAAVAFTGSTPTAQTIRRAMAEHLATGAPLVAETGGINAMIIDSTALLEQAVRDVVASAFQSAGQRCSALRCVYVQDDIAPAFREMLTGAVEALTMGDPWDLATDIGPLIDEVARKNILKHLEDHDAKPLIAAPKTGTFLAPTLIEVPNVSALQREIFGPVLHIATFKADGLDQVISDINSTGYGLTFGLHTRIDSRVQDIVERIHVGNVYVNRNQIGAVVGTQPFGGEGLSGTGPKAGGPSYVARFTKDTDPGAKKALNMPGPTGETNRLTENTRHPFLCIGPGTATAEEQRRAVEKNGGIAISAPDMTPEKLGSAKSIGGAVYWGDEAQSRAYAKALAGREGAILPLITGTPRSFEVRHERHLCVDTTASGGNAALLAAVSDT
ncbi:bifunctional proline dehydrogenase/L-glutamate gamma-semialdehyde dehydrogenase PutA [Boseongicola aestuarii]|nr:bifunctional proline dehydrogenase/L-glutamate gamma-semialdehyde dehydrogenase PutA [Boseongicola aestuarii]